MKNVNEVALNEFEVVTLDDKKNLVVITESNEDKIREAFRQGNEDLLKFVDMITEFANQEMVDIALVEKEDIEKGFSLRRQLGTAINKATNELDKVGQEAFQIAQDAPRIISNMRKSIQDAINGDDGIRTQVLEPIRARDERKKALQKIVNDNISMIDGILSSADGLTVEQIDEKMKIINDIQIDFTDHVLGVKLEDQEIKFDAKRFVAQSNLKEVREQKVIEAEVAAKKAEEERIAIEKAAKEKAEKEAADAIAKAEADKKAAEEAAARAAEESAKALAKAEADAKKAAEEAQAAKERAEIKAAQDLANAQKEKEEAAAIATKAAEQRAAAAEAKKLEEEKTREANVENRKRVNNGIVEAIESLLQDEEFIQTFKKATKIADVPESFTKEQAYALVVALATKRIPNVKIEY